MTPHSLFPRLLPCLSVLVAAGCATVPLGADFPESAIPYTGQVHYESDADSLDMVGEMTLRADATRFHAVVTKGPGAPLLEIASNAETTRVAVSGRPAWTGRGRNAPAPLGAWAALPDAWRNLAEPSPGASPSGTCQSPEGWSARASSNGKVSLQMDWPERGQRIDLRLQPANSR